MLMSLDLHHGTVVVVVAGGIETNFLEFSRNRSFYVASRYSIRSSWYHYSPRHGLDALDGLRDDPPGGRLQGPSR